MGIVNPYFYAYNPELLALENAWVKFIKTEEVQTNVIKDDIADSWRRCKVIGLDPLIKEPPLLIDEKLLKDKLNKNKEILKIVSPFMETIYENVKTSGFRVDFADSEGCILKSFSEGENYEISKRTMSLVGAMRKEEIVGTNSIDLAIKLKKPVQVIGSEHYLQIFHRWACSSAAILDENKDVLGVINIVGRYELVNQHTLGILYATVKAIENELQIQSINKKLKLSNKELATILTISTDATVYIADNRIKQINKAMCSLLGKTEKDILDGNVFEEIITTPTLEEMISAESGGYKEGEVIIKGKLRSYKCLFKFENVLDENNNKIGTVMVFTKVDEIQELANKIKYTAKYKFEDIVGNTPNFIDTIEIAKKAAGHDSRVIIEGESGTGKEMFAQAIHNSSTRRYGPFIAVDCGTLNKSLLESELFGYEKGSFTGANKDGKPGIFEIANKGTIFLDEIGNMSMEMQIKMLRVLQEGSFTRVGGTQPIKTDVRIIAATNASLKQQMEDETFRKDLFYRLNVFHIKTQALRDRREDIIPLAKFFIENSALRKGDVRIDRKAEKALLEYSWPGNIRQLNNTIERALIMSSKGVIHLSDLPYEISNTEKFHMAEETEIESLDEIMNDYIVKVLKKCNNNVTKTSRLLKISRNTVYKAINYAEKE